MDLQRMQPEAVPCRSITSVILLFCKHTVGQFTVVNSQNNCYIICAHGNVYSSLQFKSNEFAKDEAISSSLHEHKILQCAPRAKGLQILCYFKLLLLGASEVS